MSPDTPQTKYDLETISSISFFTQAADSTELLLDKVVHSDSTHDLGIFLVLVHKSLTDEPILPRTIYGQKGYCSKLHYAFLQASQNLKKLGKYPRAFGNNSNVWSRVPGQ